MARRILYSERDKAWLQLRYEIPNTLKAINIVLHRGDCRMRLHFSARERRDRLLRIASQPDSSWSGPLVAVSTMTPTASAAYDLGDPAL